MGRKLYVGNFPYETGEAELQGLFARAGTVETVKVMRDMATGRARGFAFVEMSTEDEAQKAIAELNEYQLGGAQSLRQRSAAEARICRRVRRRRVAASLRAALVSSRKTGGGQGGRLVPSPRRAAWPVIRRQQCCVGRLNK